MARIKYSYDTETCRYDRVKVTFSDVVMNMLGFFSVALLMAVAVVLVYNTYFDTPEAALLKKENRELKKHLVTVGHEIKDIKKVVTALEVRDNNLYRKIYEADPIPEATTSKSRSITAYKKILESGLQDQNIVMAAFVKIDKLKQKARQKNKKFEDIAALAREKREIISSLPAIQPVHNSELTKLVSGYGMRINPFHKGSVMHEGIDFAAPRGTPVYATGNGKVIFVKNDSQLETGYGNYIEIDHGMGYVTKYAHLGKVTVKYGQHVKKGEEIAEVGSSGGSAAPHLHYEVMKDGKKIDPINFIIQGIDDSAYAKLLDLSKHENQSFD